MKLKGIYISNPCNENWNGMEKSDNARFCHNCKEFVHDFTNVSENDLNKILNNSNGNVCGRFYEYQIDINLKSSQPSHGILSAIKNHIYSAWTFIIFNLVTIYESKGFYSDVKVQEVQSLNAETKIHEDSLNISGKIIDQNNNIVSGAYVELRDESGKIISSCQSNQEGNFVIIFNSLAIKDKLVLSVLKKHNQKGYSIKSQKHINLKVNHCNNLVIKMNLNRGKKSKLRMVMGKVRRPIPTNNSFKKDEFKTH